MSGGGATCGGMRGVVFPMSGRMLGKFVDCVFQWGMIRLGYLGGHVCVMLATGVCCMGCLVVSGLAVVFGGCVVGFYLDHLVRPLLLTCMCCFACGVGSGDLAHLNTLVKIVVVSCCLDARRSCSGVGPLGRLFIGFPSNPCQRLAIRVDRGSGLESVSVGESRCSGDRVDLKEFA
jgi:hypothetical protein